MGSGQKRCRERGNRLAKAQIEKTSLGRPSITDIKVKTLFVRNNGCRHSPGVHVLVRVCAPRIPLWRWNHWIIKPADANRREQSRRWPSEGVSSGARLLREAQITSNKESEHIHSGNSHRSGRVIFNFKKFEKCALRIGNRDVFQLLNSHDSVHLPLTPLFMLFWPRVIIWGCTIQLIIHTFMPAVFYRIIQKMPLSQACGFWLARSAGSIWDCHQTAICCVDIPITSGMLQLPCLHWHFKTRHGPVRIIQNIDMSWRIRRAEGESEGGGKNVTNVAFELFFKFYFCSYFYTCL